MTRNIQAQSRRRAAGRVARAAALVALTATLAGCEALLIGGAVVGTSLVVSDRRTTGIQVEDQSIASKAQSRASALATLGRINVHSFNRLVLITGEVPSEPDKAAVEKAVAAVENVRSVVNELAVAPSASMSVRSSDTLLETKVKTGLVEAADLQSNAFKVIASRGTVYLMGRVTEREANRAAEVARTTSGVQKVVKVFELMTEDELATLNKTLAPK